MCKFYISASLKGELFISRDRRDDSLLFKVVSKRGVRQFYCPTSNLEIFPREISSLGYFIWARGESVSRIREKVYRRWKIRVFFSLHFCFMHESIGGRLGWRVSRRLKAVDDSRRESKSFREFSVFSVDKQFSFGF